jgi:alpha-L-rhamnosidase
MPETAPYVGIADSGMGGGSGPIGWGITHPYLQEQLYLYYGNEQIIRKQYETTKRWIEFLRSHANENIINDCLGDWEGIEPKSIPLTATAYYYNSVRMLAKFAEILGKREDAKNYEILTEQIKEAFIKKFLNPGTGEFENHTQACQSFALFYDLAPDDKRNAAIDVLVDQIINHDKGHVAAGFTGTRMMLDVLSNSGKADVAYTVANQKTYPGWGYMLENGATTLWEHWAFSDNIFSHNHASFGSVDAWFFKVLGGVNPDPEAIGFDKIIIKPQILGDLKWAKASYNSIHGLIVAEWKLDGDTLKLDIIIPANTTATIYVPAAEVDNVSESGKAAAEAEDIRFLRIEKGSVVFSSGSGEYHFKSSLKR